MKLNLKKTLIIAMGFFTISLAWTIYNSYVPVFLDNLRLSSTLIAVIMTIDNLFGILFQPFFGKLSDKTWNRFGRRMPYIIMGIPASAVFFFIIPWHDRLGMLIPTIDFRILVIMISVIMMNFSMSIYRAPAIALMPDATPAPLRSRANGIIVAMGGIGTVIALSAGGVLFNINASLPFMLGAGLMLASALILYVFHKEPKTPYSADEGLAEEADTGLLIGKGGNKAAAAANPSLLFMLLTVFFWFCGFECINTFFTLHCKEKFGLNAGDATLMLAPMVLIFIFCAYPAGLLGGGIGRKFAMMIGNIIVVASFLLIVLTADFTITSILLALSGIGWALINSNAYPAIAQMAPNSQTGRYTGYYYAFTFAASIASPIAYGVLSDLTGSHAWLFLFGGVMFAVAFAFMLPVKSEAAAK